jgi:hypothetical protein
MALSCSRCRTTPDGVVRERRGLVERQRRDHRSRASIALARGDAPPLAPLLRTEDDRHRAERAEHDCELE